MLHKFKFKFYLIFFLIITITMIITNIDKDLNYLSNRIILKDIKSIEKYDLIQISKEQILFLFTDYNLDDHDKKHSLRGVILTPPDFKSYKEIEVPKYINPKNINLFKTEDGTSLALSDKRGRIHFFEFDNQQYSFSKKTTLPLKDEVYTFNIERIEHITYLSYSTTQNRNFFTILSKEDKKNKWKTLDIKIRASLPPSPYLINNNLFFLTIPTNNYGVRLTNLNTKKENILSDFISIRHPSLTKVGEKYIIAVNDTKQTMLNLYELVNYNKSNMKMKKQVFLPLLYGNNNFTFTNFNNTPVFTQTLANGQIMLSILDKNQTIKNGLLGSTFARDQ